MHTPVKSARSLNCCNNIKMTTSYCVHSGTNDVHNVDESVTTEEARAALCHAASHHDAEQGINWFTLEAALDAIRQ
jgi:hypothetical protein